MINIITTVFSIVCILAGIVYGLTVLVKKRDSQKTSDGANFVVNHIIKQVKERGEIKLVLDGVEMVLIEKTKKNARSRI